MSKRPNILFLMSDQHRASVTGYEGDPVVRTPTLDWLAETGVAFRNAYAPSPICVPGRQAMMSGQLPRTCRCECYGHDLPPFSMTFAKRLAQYAYRTVCVGKLHHMGADQMQGWTNRLAPDAEIHDSVIDGRVAEEFESYKPAPGIGKWTNNKEIMRAGIAHGRYQEFDEAVIDSTHLFVRRHFLDPEYDRPGCHRPLLLKVSLLQPHYPYFADAEKFEYYLKRVPVWNNEPRFDHPRLSRTQCGPDVDVSDRDARRATAAYYSMVETVDEHFTDVLEHLEHVGEDLDDWIIIYTSDHGDMLGEHGIWEKTQMFEGSARIPLIIRWPKRFKPAVVDENVSLCDLFATLCELTGVPMPEAGDTVHGAGFDSRSLVPLMDGDASGWQEQHHNEAVSQCHGCDVMIKRDALKYISFDREGAKEVLFDLARDPAEMSNEIDNPDYTKAIAAFRQRRRELGFGPDADPDYRNAGYP